MDSAPANYKENRCERPMTQPNIGGALDAPVFEPIPNPGAILKREWVNPYAKLLDSVREFPGQWAKIAVFRGVKAKTKTAVNTARSSVVHYLQTKHRLEHWEVATRNVPDTWSDKALWVRYIGPWTEAERAEFVAKNRMTMDARRELGKHRRAQRQADQILADQREQNRRSRQRGG
jgi:hypothetical protein